MSSQWINGTIPVPAIKGLEELITTARTMRHYLYWKDEIHEAYLRINFFACKIFQELGRRIGLAQPNDIFHADHQAIQAYVSAATAENLQALLTVVDHQRTIRHMYRHFKVPCSIYKYKANFSRRRRALQEPPAGEQTTASGARILRTLSGTGCSSGTASGRVVVCKTLSDTATLAKGDILVAEMTSPSWTPLFSVAAAVVVEHGGRLSHAALVAREVGIPCVMSVEDATDILKSGQFCLVDGTTGDVHLLDLSSSPTSSPSSSPSSPPSSSQ